MSRSTLRAEWMRPGCRVGWWLAALVIAVVPGSSRGNDAALPALMLPASSMPVHFAIEVPAAIKPGSATAWQLGKDQPSGTVALEVVPGWNERGMPDSERPRLAATVIPLEAKATGGERVLQLARRTVQDAAKTPFRFDPTTDKSLTLYEGARPVFTYNHGMISKAGVPADRNRSTYLHPVYGLDGEILTDDFPKDHYHHRGVFWAWPHVRVDEKSYSTWDIKGIEQRFERWLARETNAAAATLGVENGWYIRGRKVVQERVWIRTFPAAIAQQCIDIDLFLIPLRPIALAGAEGKSYGGITFRFAPRMDTRITTPASSSAEDLYMTRLPWADLTARFGQGSETSGAALFISPDHPDYPPTWLTRHYGVLCVGWPGVQERSFQPDETIHCRYRLWLHKGSSSPAEAYRAYQFLPRWKQP